MDEYSLPVYSYYPQCVRCSTNTNNWPKYLAVSLLSTTVFFLVVITFRLRLTSSILNGYLILSQVLTSPPSLMRCIGESIFKNHYEKTLIGYGIYGYYSFFGIWNLDFFRLVHTPFCLHPNTTTLQELSLDYITAVYPLVLIILTYTLVRLHYNNCTLVV